MRLLAGRLMFGVTLALSAAAMSAHAADKIVRLPGAQIMPLQFSALDGWTADDHADAFRSFLKSCKAIRDGGETARTSRPVTGALYEVCAQALAAARAGAVDRAQA